MILDIPTKEEAKEFYWNLIQHKLEEADDNLFVNYNNYSRDEFCCKRTFEECWEVIQGLTSAVRMFKYQRDYLEKEKKEAK